jgi:hypothetical protein
MASTFFTSFVEVMVDLGIPRERAETLSEKDYVAKIRLQMLRERAESDERISRIDERINQRSRSVESSVVTDRKTQ